MRAVPATLLKRWQTEARAILENSQAATSLKKLAARVLKQWDRSNGNHRR